MGDEQYLPPSGPPPSYRDPHDSTNQPQTQQDVSWANNGRSSELASNNPFRNAHVNAPQEQPPSDPPAYQSPTGPPMDHSDDKKPLPDDDYVSPPSGPPPQPQPGKDVEPPPYDPWLSVPDNALLPPPPSFHEDKSPASNASWDDAARAREWCRVNPLWRPRRQNQQTLTRISNGDVRFTSPPNTDHIQLSHPGVGRTHIRSSPKCKDTILLTDIPLYPATTGRPRTIYFELKILSIGSQEQNPSEEADASIAIGFVAPPYPAWRQPGWHRASLAVHSDDGRRYVDDSFGGRDFTSHFRKNDTVGIGMTFSPPSYVEGKNKVEIFFTRNGKRDGGWDLHEEKDQEQDGGNVFGLEGDHDLLGAVGCFGGVEFEVRSRRQEWMFQPTL